MNLMPLLDQHLSQQVADGVFVIHNEKAPRPLLRLHRHLGDLACSMQIHGQENPNRRSLPHFALDFDVPLVPVHDPIGHAHSESVTLYTLGCEKWIEYTAADFLCHAAPGVSH